MTAIIPKNSKNKVISKQNLFGCLNYNITINNKPLKSIILIFYLNLEEFHWFYPLPLLAHVFTYWFNLFSTLNRNLNSLPNQCFMPKHAISNRRQ